MSSWRNPSFLDDVLDPAKKSRAVVRDGIDRFTGEAYAASFGFEWVRFARTQYDRAELPADFRPTEFLSAEKWTPAYDSLWRKDPWIRNSDRDTQFDTALTFSIKSGTRPEVWKGRAVLDVGCGSGRFVEVLARAGARVVGVDASRAVDAAAEVLGEHGHGKGPDGRVALLQADALDLPFREKSFDLIYSIGVLHHTPDVRRAILSLAPYLAPGGRLVVWLYHPTSAGRNLGMFWWRILRHLPNETLLALLRPLCALYPLHRLQPWGMPFRFLFPICMHPDPEMRLCGTFDSYSPHYTWKVGYPEAIGWLREAGLERVEIGPFPTSVRGHVP